MVSRVRILQDRLFGKLLTLGLDLNVEAQLDVVTLEIIKTSEIEGETLNNEQVRSSVARQSGVDDGGMTAINREIEAVVEW